MLEATERQLGSAAVATLRGRLPPRLAPHASAERLRASTVLDALPLNEGAEILLAIDAMLGDGSGRLLESIGNDLAARVLSHGGGVVRAGDLFGTVARLQTFLEHPFVGAPVAFELRRTPSGFSLSIGVTGHARASRALRHLAIGAVVAAQRFAREAGVENLKVHAESSGDRSNINAHYLVPEECVTREAAAPSRRPLPVARASSTSLSEEVERILGPSSAQRKNSADPAGASPASSRTRISVAARVPSFSPVELEDALPESATRQRERGQLKKPGGTDRR